MEMIRNSVRIIWKMVAVAGFGSAIYMGVPSTFSQATDLAQRLPLKRRLSATYLIQEERTAIAEGTRSAPDRMIGVADAMRTGL